VAADARVAYIDIDPVVLAHLRALAAHGNPGVTVVEGDAREIAVILDAIGDAIDLSGPACLLMGALLHFFPPDAARGLAAGYVAGLAPGSYVVLSVGRTDDNDTAQGFGTYSSAGAAQAYNHSAAEFASFFGPLTLVPPGVVDAREWHPDGGQSAPLPPRVGQALVGVARVLQ
jgi:O-methyltransferase involved in polyketide biosynthesis